MNERRVSTTLETTYTPRTHFLVDESLSLSFCFSISLSHILKLLSSKVAVVTARIRVAKRGRQKIKTVTPLHVRAYMRACVVLSFVSPCIFFTRTRVARKKKGIEDRSRDKLISAPRRACAVSRVFLTKDEYVNPTKMKSLRDVDDYDDDDGSGGSR